MGHYDKRAKEKTQFLDSSEIVNFDPLEIHLAQSSLQLRNMRLKDLNLDLILLELPFDGRTDAQFTVHEDDIVADVLVKAWRVPTDKKLVFLADDKTQQFS